MTERICQTMTSVSVMVFEHLFPRNYHSWYASFKELVLPASMWFKSLIALSRIDFDRRAHPRDCMLSTGTLSKQGRPRIAL